jgi:hypothetical protein
MMEQLASLFDEEDKKKDARAGRGRGGAKAAGGGTAGGGKTGGTKTGRRAA